MFVVSSKRIFKRVFLVALLASAAVGIAEGAEEFDGAEQHVSSAASPTDTTTDAAARDLKKKSKKVHKASSKKGEESGKTSKKGHKSSSKEKEGKRKKSKKSTDDFVEYVLGAMDEIQEAVCDDEELAATCTTINFYTELGVANDYESTLLPYYYANFRAMTLAYPLFSLLEQMPALVLPVFQIHRALGFGNSKRLLGYAEDVVNESYWQHYALLQLEDENAPRIGDGINVYCDYISQEFEQLRKFGLDNYNVTTAQPTALFGFLCNDLNVLGYIVRSDWEHHRRETVGSLMKTSNTEAIVTYTIFHWESLLNVPGGNGAQVVAFLVESFNTLIGLQS
jgi:hypothetical protein